MDRNKSSPKKNDGGGYPENKCADAFWVVLNIFFSRAQSEVFKILFVSPKDQKTD